MASLPASAVTVGGYTLLSRLLGFARDLLIARLFGADAGTDAFVVAFKIPNLARRLFAEGSLALALIPVMSGARARGGAAALGPLAGDLFGTLGLLLLGVTALGVLGAPLLLFLFAPGFSLDGDTQRLAGQLLRLTLPYLLFVGLTAIAGALLQTHERFGVPAFTPALLNVALIGCALGLAPRLSEPILALGWGVLLGGVAQLLFQWPFLARLGLSPRPRVNWRNAAVREVLNGLGPALLGLSVTHISLLIDTLLASFLTAGSISWLYYAERLVEFPLGLLGVALGTVIAPRLARQHGAAAADPFARTLDWALRWAVLLGLPAAVGLTMLAEPIVALLFYSPRFGEREVLMAAHGLMAYAVGLMAFIAIKVIGPGFYSRADGRTPARIAALAILAKLLFSALLMAPCGHVGLALATSLAAGLNAVLLLRYLRRAGAFVPGRGWPALGLRGVGAALSMALLLGVLSGPGAAWIAPGGAARLAGLILLGGLWYLASLWLLGLRPRHVRDWNRELD